MEESCKKKKGGFSAASFKSTSSERQSHSLNSRDFQIETAVPLVSVPLWPPRHSVWSTLYLKANLRPNYPKAI
jgi:hypothetical protein